MLKAKGSENPVLTTSTCVFGCPREWNPLGQGWDWALLWVLCSEIHQHCWLWVTTSPSNPKSVPGEGTGGVHNKIPQRSPWCSRGMSFVGEEAQSPSAHPALLPLPAHCPKHTVGSGLAVPRLQYRFHGCSNLLKENLHLRALAPQGSKSVPSQYFSKSATLDS